MKPLPVNGLCLLEYLHDISDADGLFADHNRELLGNFMFFLLNAEGFVFENRFVVLVAEQDVRSHVIVGVLIDVL